MQDTTRGGFWEGLFSSAGAVNSSFFPKIGTGDETQVDLDMGDVKIHLDLDSGGVKIHSKGVPWAPLGPPLGFPWAPLGRPEPPLGLSWPSFGFPLAPLGLPWTLFGVPLGSLWRLKWRKGVSVLHGRGGVFEGSGGS